MQERNFRVGIPRRRFRTNKPCTQGGTARRIIHTYTWKRLMSIRVVMVSGCCLPSVFGLSAPSAADCFNELPCLYASRGIVPTAALSARHTGSDRPLRDEERHRFKHYRNQALFDCQWVGFCSTSTRTSNFFQNLVKRTSFHRRSTHRFLLNTRRIRLKQKTVRAIGLNPIHSLTKRQLEDLILGTPYHNMDISMRW